MVYCPRQRSVFYDFTCFGSYPWQNNPAMIHIYGVHNKIGNSNHYYLKCWYTWRGVFINKNDGTNFWLVVCFAFIIILLLDSKIILWLGNKMSFLLCRLIVKRRKWYEKGATLWAEFYVRLLFHLRGNRSPFN
jgi:hypothetical protein